jgi:hypothetical protein
MALVSSSTLLEYFTIFLISTFIFFLFPVIAFTNIVCVYSLCMNPIAVLLH